MLIDTHAHLYWDSYKDDFDEVIQRSLDAGVTTIINVGVDVEKSKIAAELNSDKIKFFSTIGIHPHEVLRYTQGKLSEEIEELEQIYRRNTSKVIAVGECGLDYFQDQDNNYKNYKNHNYYNNQKKLFQAQVDLAKKLNLPLIVHCRDDRSKGSGSTGPSAWDEVLKMVGTHPAILHCYSGLSQTTNSILQTTRSARGARRANLLVSFAATITYPKNEYLREAVKMLPLEKIVLETDCPFLPPQSKRGQRNEPSAVLEIAQLIADIKGVSLEKVANQTTDNVKKILRLVFDSEG